MGGNAQIYGNSADEGGGVYIHGSGKLYITGGVIYGTNAPDSLKNTANPGSGAALYEGSGTAEMGSFGSSGALPLASSPQPLSSTDDTILWAP